MTPAEVEALLDNAVTCAYILRYAPVDNAEDLKLVRDANGAVLHGPYHALRCNSATLIDALTTALRAALERAEANERDAEWYRWLRANHWKPYSRNIEIDAGYYCDFTAGTFISGAAGADMDEAVDFFAPRAAPEPTREGEK